MAKVKNVGKITKPEIESVARKLENVSHALPAKEKALFSLLLPGA
jgi:hypothetical protein